MGKVLPSQRLLKQFEERLVFGDMNLSEIVRSGAQMMLQYALEREVTEALGRGYYENAPETTKEKGRRNGYESHRVLTGEGAVTVQVPQIRETSTGFRSKILDAYVSRTEKLDELIARMYVHGMSTRDIEATFADVLSGTGVSKSVVSRVTQCLSDDFEVFRKRDLSSEELLYLELDGTFLRYHQGAEKKEPILVATGYRIDGTRVLLHIGVGNGESYANWKGFLQEMVARGLREPLLIVTDGNPGVLKAIEEVFPQSLKQRCQKHRLENILGKAPKEIHDELKAEILESFHAKSYEQGLKKGREVITRYRQRFPSAMNGMEETLEACLQVLRLPEAHHKRLRTSNLLERTFGELKRRTKVIPHFFTEQAAIKLSFAVLLATASKWRGVRMDVFTIRRIEELRNEFLPKSTSEETSSLTEPGEPYGDLTGKLGLDRVVRRCRRPRVLYGSPVTAGFRNTRRGTSTNNRSGQFTSSYNYQAGGDITLVHPDAIVEIQSIDVEARWTCSLKPSAALPPSEVEFTPVGGSSAYLVGEGGRARLTFISPVRFRGVESDRVTVLNRYALGSGDRLRY